jgi:multimeric flavodoxin WrbA
MKIVVLNGSPKGNRSVTLQYARFLEKKRGQHTFQVFHIAHDIRRIESEETVFRDILDAVKEADGVLWAFPLYYLLVHSQYKRFIELIWERRVEDVFRDKYTGAMSTSIHFFDHTAHNYIHGICDDLGMKFLGSYSADMHDLLKKPEQERLLVFFDLFLRGVEKGVSTAREHPPLTANSFCYEPLTQAQPVDPGDRHILVLTDHRPEETDLLRMVGRLKSCFIKNVTLVNLADLAMKGGCLGCLRCGYDNTCVYEGKDGFTDFFRGTVEKAEVVVFAGAMRDRYLSSTWKMFFDRSFFNNHFPYLTGKQAGFLISGPLGQVPNLRQILESYIEMHGGNLAGIVTDEGGDSSKMDELIDGLAHRLIECGTSGYVKPPTFLGVGGHKVFRDDIFGRLRFPFQADHARYKKSGAYDFPQKDYKARITSAVLMLLTKIPAMRREIYQKRMIEEMVKPFRKVVDRAG